MFVREKRISLYTYVHLVETICEDGRAKQRIIRIRDADSTPAAA